MSAARGFTAIPNAVIRDASIPPSTRLLFGVIMSYAYGSRVCTASADTLCEDAGIGRSAFFEGIALLRERGLVDVQKRKSKNGWRNVYVPIAKGVEIPDDEDEGGSPTSGRRVVQDSDEGLSATRTQKKKENEEGSEADASDQRASEKKADPRDSLPPEFPEDLKPHARHVFRVLRSVAEQHGAKKVWPLSLGRLMMSQPHKPFVATAHELHVWAADPGRPVKNVVQTYGTFLSKKGELATFERINAEGLPASGPVSPEGVTSLHGRRLSNAEQVDLNIRRLRGDVG
jgi:hypothetical protein